MASFSMKLPEYKTLSDKHEIFNEWTINNRRELDDFIERIKNCSNFNHYIFRGVSEAKYKNFTSAQRHWITQELEKTEKSFNEFINTSSKSHKISSIPDFVATTYTSNLNLIAQEGVFIFYNDPTIPLEEYFLKNPLYKLMPITCVNIHKSLKDYIIKKYLKPRHISHESMYPQEEDIAKQAFSIFKKEM